MRQSSETLNRVLTTFKRSGRQATALPLNSNELSPSTNVSVPGCSPDRYCANPEPEQAHQHLVGSFVERGTHDHSHLDVGSSHRLRTKTTIERGLLPCR